MTDETLRTFVESRIVQAGIDVQAMKIEQERDQVVIKAQQQKIEDLRVQIEKKKTKR